MSDEKHVKRVMIEVMVAVGDDFDLQDIAIGKYVEDTIAEAEFILPKDEDFEVIDYISIKEVGQ